MDHTRIASQSQVNVHVQGKISAFFNRFQIGSLMHRCGFRKHHGHSVRSLTQASFTLPFIGKNFFQGIVLNEDLPFGKHTVYLLLRVTNFNWRRLLLGLDRKLFGVFNPLTEPDRESVLIIDDSPYDQFRSKWVELLYRVWDHSTGHFLKGFRMLTIRWSDGTSCLPLDFALLSSRDPKKRLCDRQKHMDKRCCSYQRRKEATVKPTALLEPMVKRIPYTSIRARYLPMDSWFTMPATVAALSSHIHIISMVKKTPKIHYTYNGTRMDVMSTVYSSYIHQ